MVVFELLYRGEENAITTADLLRLTGLRNARELRAQISKERGEGHLVLSTCRGRGGYFLPSEGAEGRREIEAFCATLRSRAVNTFRALRNARRALGVLEGQIDLLDGAEGGVQCE